MFDAGWFLSTVLYVDLVGNRLLISKLVSFNSISELSVEEFVFDEIGGVSWFTADETLFNGDACRVSESVEC